MFVQHKTVQTTPKGQAVKFFAAARSKDWKTVFATSETIASSYPSAAAYEKKMKENEKSPLFAPIYDDLMVKAEPTIGEPAISGNVATIPLTVTRQFRT